MKCFFNFLTTLAFLTVLFPELTVASDSPANTPTPDHYVMPFKPDPPFTIDANLDDWSQVPNRLILDRAEQVSLGAATWSGTDDLSATVRLAWRDGGIAIAAEVMDEKVIQPYSGQDLWQGDHVIVFMDLTPGVEPERTMLGTGQCQVAISPGNFNQADGNAAGAEIMVYRPQGAPPQGGEVASRRTEQGYVVEAYIPYARLGIATVSMHQDANFEVAISDSDSIPATQETFLTIGSAPWELSRTRLLPMIFGDGNGKAPPPLRSVTIAPSTTIEPGETHTMSFVVDALPAGKEALVFLRARVPSPIPGGYRHGAMGVELNGHPLAREELSNRPVSSTMMDGRELRVFAADGWTLPWAPDFVALDADSNYRLIDNSPAAEFEFRVSDVLCAGRNELSIKNLMTDDAIECGGAELRIRAKPPAAPALAPAPTGAIATIEPQTEFPKTYSDLGSESGRITFTVAAQAVAVASRFATDDGMWRDRSNEFFTHRREIIEHNEWIEIRDHFANLTNRDLPLVQEHSWDGAGQLKSIWLAGLPVISSTASRSEPENPSTFAVTDSIGVGLLPLSDIFQVHVNQFARPGAAGIRDVTFYLPPRAQYTAEWAIVPAPRPDFWTFVNAARRLRDVNFPLTLNFAFLFGKDPIYDWPDSTFKAYIENKGTNFVVKSYEGLVNADGHYPRMTEWMRGPLTQYVDLFKRVRQFFPQSQVRTGIYFDCFLDSTRENDVRFKEDRALDASGNHMDYGGSGAYQRLFVPTTRPGGWGEEAMRWIDVILNEVGADGIYWDEPNYSSARYVYSHQDGCSADLDPQTFKLIRKKGSVPLLSQEFRLKIIQRLIDGNIPFLTNGAPVTRSVLKHKFQAFCETGSISNCRQMLLHSPVALGDHLTERKYEDAYRTMHGALDNGCLYVFYDPIHTPTRAPTYYMYPFTPIEIHSGYMIGQERIITNRSGYFGWGDSSGFTPHVFDRHGVETSEITIPLTRRDGKHYAEVRLPEGFMAILVRTPDQPASH